MSAEISENHATRREKGKVSWLRRAAIALAAVFLCWLLGVPLFVRVVLEHVYTPPALTPRRIAVYRDFIAFVERHPDYDDVTLTEWGDLGFDLRYCRLDSSSEEDAFLQEVGLSAREGRELAQLSRLLRRTGCTLAWKTGSVVIFYHSRNRLLPTSPGVLYSLDGSEPNLDQSPDVAASRPFWAIAGRWYASRKLVTPAFRGTDIGSALPEAWIDKSLDTQGLDLHDE